MRACVLAAAIGALGLVFSAAATAANSLHTQYRILSDEVHIYGTFRISPPLGCPPHEPSMNVGNPSKTLAELKAYSSSRCQRYVQQDADLELVVRRNGKIVYHDQVIGFPGSDPSQGDTFDEEISRYVLPAGCGVFYWRITLYDPYFRPGYSKSTTGAFKC